MTRGGPPGGMVSDCDVKPGLKGGLTWLTVGWFCRIELGEMEWGDMSMGSGLLPNGLWGVRGEPRPETQKKDYINNNNNNNNDINNNNNNKNNKNNNNNYYNNNNNNNNSNNNN